MDSNQGVTYDRQVLYDEIWAEPMRDVAVRYGVSGVALAKTCRRLGVPVPGRGYWAKKTAGKADPRPPLPAHSGRSAIVVDRGSHDTAAKHQALMAGREIPLITVAATLRRPHALVAATRDAFPRDRGVGSGYMRSHGGLDLSVSRPLLGRALRILDALVKGLEARGMTVEVGPEVRTSWGVRDWRESFATRALCGGEPVSFALREPARAERVPPSETDRQRGAPDDRTRTSYYSGGVLELSLTNPRLRGLRRTWKDGKR